MGVATAFRNRIHPAQRTVRGTRQSICARRAHAATPNVANPVNPKACGASAPIGRMQVPLRRQCQPMTLSTAASPCVKQAAILAGTIPDAACRRRIDIAIPYRFYADLLSLGSLSMAGPNLRTALLAADTADAETLVRALSGAFANFDRGRSLVGEIAGATPSAVAVKAIYPTVDAKRLRQRQGGSADAGKGRGTSGKPVAERSGRTPNRGPTQATTRSVKDARNTSKPSREGRTPAPVGRPGGRGRMIPRSSPGARGSRR